MYKYVKRPERIFNSSGTRVRSKNFPSSLKNISVFSAFCFFDTEESPTTFDKYYRPQIEEITEKAKKYKCVNTTLSRTMIANSILKVLMSQTNWTIVLLSVMMSGPDVLEATTFPSIVRKPLNLQSININLS
mmetsp:Transcript_26168/g.37469  ORF Transcript_26168/g.37469 Transcript_26168/m.37469 type:complete len:132 (+) Transcript_26168:95-490(+)